MPTYLAKNGKTFGPFNADELEELKESGEFFKYEYMWDGKSPDWARVPPPVPPPPVPMAAPAAPQAPAAAPASAAQPQAEPSPAAPAPAAEPQSQAKVVFSDKVFQAVCHDFHRLLSGVTRKASASGCELVSEQPGETAAFSPGAKVWIDLLDESTDRSVTLQAKVGQVRREGERWIYQIQWQNNPLL